MFSLCVCVSVQSGGWVGCVAVDGDWLVCGGSMAPCVYHLSSLSATVRLPSPDGVATQAAIFAKDRVGPQCVCE